MNGFDAAKPLYSMEGGISMKKAFAAAALALALLLPKLALGEAPMEEGTPFTLSSPSVILMEPKTGRVIFEKNADERRPVASVTKVMTILLTLEAIDDGRVKLDEYDLSR